MKSSLPSSESVQIPPAVLTGYVFPFLGVKSLSKACLVSKSWRLAADQDVLWKVLCARKWISKQNVPRIIFKDDLFVSQIEKDGEPATLFPFARYTERCDLKVKDLKQILSLRGIDSSSFLERAEYLRAVIATQPANIEGWTGEATSKWKAAYIGAAHWAMRKTITRAELLRSVWKLTFKAQNSGMAWDAEFKADGTYFSNPPFNHPEGLRWIFVGGSGGNYESVQVGQYPVLMVRRTSDWSYYLENDYVIFNQCHDERRGR